MKKDDTQDKAPRFSADALPDALREAGAKAAELAQNPIARSMLAAGLLTAAAALGSNKKVRATVRENGRAAMDNAEAMADTASRVGAAIVTAATDAVRRAMEAGGMSSAQPAASPASGMPSAADIEPAAREEPKARPAKTRPSPAKKSAAKPKAKKAGASAKAGKKPAAKAKPVTSGTALEN